MFLKGDHTMTTIDARAKTFAVSKCWSAFSVSNPGCMTLRVSGIAFEPSQDHAATSVALRPFHTYERTLVRPPMFATQRTNRRNISINRRSASRLTPRLRPRAAPAPYSFPRSVEQPSTVPTPTIVGLGQIRLSHAITWRQTAIHPECVPPSSRE